ncbi:hypothetical protein DFS34DRAFT_591295 [Phlyctochytrium arcticum]|nr:hypothetical protein DFS34DRAFT_591295 [Phlyctochytrium arcticum]
MDEETGAPSEERPSDEPGQADSEQGTPNDEPGHEVRDLSTNATNPDAPAIGPTTSTSTGPSSDTTSPPQASNAEATNEIPPEKAQCQVCGHYVRAYQNWHGRGRADCKTPESFRVLKCGCRRGRRHLAKSAEHYHACTCTPCTSLVSKE